MPSTTIDPAQLVPPAQPRLAVFGDSTALQTGWGVANHLRESNKGAYVDGFTGLGCSVIRTDQRRTQGIGIEESDKTCNDWERVWKEKIDASHPDIAMVQVGQWEIVDRKLPGEDVWRSPGDPLYDDYLFSEMTTAVDVLSSDGGIAVWLTSPEPGPSSKQNTPGWDPAQRMRRFNELVNKLPEARPGKVVVVDLAGWVARLSPEEDARIRPDGVHFSNDAGGDTTTEVSRNYLVDAVISAWSEQWIANRESELTAGPPTPVAMFGDDSANRISEGLASWSARGRRLDVENGALPECGIGEGGFRLNRNQRERVPDTCTESERRYLTALFNSSAKVVVLHTSLWDVSDRQLSGDPTWRAPGDPVYDAYLRDAIAKTTDFLHQNGVEHVVWLLTPHIDVDREPGQPSKEYKASEPTRIDKLNDLIREVASTRPFVSVLDYAAFARDWPNGEFDDTYRPDGVVPNEAGGRSIADWLAPKLVDIAAQPPAQAPHQHRHRHRHRRPVPEQRARSGVRLHRAARDVARAGVRARDRQSRRERKRAALVPLGEALSRNRHRAWAGCGRSCRRRRLARVDAVRRRRLHGGPRARPALDAGGDQRVACARTRWCVAHDLRDRAPRTPLRRRRMGCSTWRVVRQRPAGRCDCIDSLVRSCVLVRRGGARSWRLVPPRRQRNAQPRSR